MKLGFRPTFECFEKRLALAGDAPEDGGYLRSGLETGQTASTGSMDFRLLGSSLKVSDRLFANELRPITINPALNDQPPLGAFDGLARLSLRGRLPNSGSGVASYSSMVAIPIATAPPAKHTPSPASPDISSGPVTGSFAAPANAGNDMATHPNLGPFHAIATAAGSGSPQPTAFRSVSLGPQSGVMPPTAASRIQALPIASSGTTSAHGSHGDRSGGPSAPVDGGGPIDVGLAIEQFTPKFHSRPARSPFASSDRPAADDHHPAELARALVFSQTGAATTPPAEPGLPAAGQPESLNDAVEPAPPLAVPPRIVPLPPEQPVTLRTLSLSASATAALIWASQLIQPLTAKAEGSPPPRLGRRLRRNLLAIRRSTDRRA